MNTAILGGIALDHKGREEKALAVQTKSRGRGHEGPEKLAGMREKLGPQGPPRDPDQPLVKGSKKVEQIRQKSEGGGGPGPRPSTLEINVTRTLDRGFRGTV